MGMPGPDWQGKVIAKAVEDPGFLILLKADPRQAIENLTGLKLPPEVEVIIVQETPGKVFLVLPFQSASQDLSEQDLEQLSGGDWEDGDPGQDPRIGRRW